jgi:hypothetical protein
MGGRAGAGLRPGARLFLPPAPGCNRPGLTDVVEPGIDDDVVGLLAGDAPEGEVAGDGAARRGAVRDPGSRVAFTVIAVPAAVRASAFRCVAMRCGRDGR